VHHFEPGSSSGLIITAHTSLYLFGSQGRRGEWRGHCPRGQRCLFITVS